MIKKTKRKTRIKSAIAATIVAALALFVPLSASAQVQLPAPTSYNFQNLTNANMAETPTALNANYYRGASITATDAYNGSFTVTVENTLSSTSLIFAKKFGELCPYLKVGETVVISWEAEGANYADIQWLNGSSYGSFYTSGTPIQVTSALLNSYIVLYPFKASASVGDSVTYTNFRVNFNEQKPFEPYSITQNYVTYLNSIYTGAYNNGVVEGLNSSYPQNAIFTASNLQEISFVFRNENDLEHIVQSSTTEENDRYTALVNSSALDGYTVNSAIFPSEVLQSPSAELYPSDLGMFFVFDAVKAGNLEFSVNLPEQTYISISLFTEVGQQYVSRKYFDNTTTTNQSYTFSNALFGLEDSTQIVAVYIEYNVNLYYPDLKPPAYYRDKFPDFVITTRTQEYANGYTNGYENGFNNGYNDGEQNGIQVGYSEGFNAGTKEGNENGYNNGYKNGYAKGKNDGYTLGAEGTSFYDLFFAVVQAPITAITGLLDFTVLDVNMSVFFFSIMTLALFVWILRKVNFLT